MSKREKLREQKAVQSYGQDGRNPLLAHLKHVDRKAVEPPLMKPFEKRNVLHRAVRVDFVEILVVKLHWGMNS